MLLRLMPLKTLFIYVHDKWLNLSQGFSDGQDINHYAATAVGDGVYEFPVALSVL